MNIYELEKRATPAPWTVDGAKPSWPMDYEEFFTLQEQANALLASHCRNNFPKVLEALKQLKAIGEGGVIERRATGKPTWHALDEIKRIATEALVELEEVK